MRRLKLFLGFATLAVIAGTAAALAGGEQGGSIRAVSATFTATTVAHLETRTCTGADGSYEIAKATYTGTATSAEPSLSGPIELKVRSVFNLTKKLGRVDGRLKIRGTHDASSGKLFAINTNGTLDGFVSGEPGNKQGTLLASLTSGFSRSGGFTSGQLGTGSSANTAVIAGREPCTGKHDDND